MKSVAPRLFALLLWPAIVSAQAPVPPAASRPSVEAPPMIDAEGVPDVKTMRFGSRFLRLAAPQDEVRIDLRKLLAEAAPTEPHWAGGPQPPERRRRPRSAGLGSVETWLDSNLMDIGKDLAEFRFETTTIRGYGRRQYAGDTPAGATDTWIESAALEEIRRDLVIRATLAGRQAAEAKVRSLEAEIGRRYKIRARMIAAKATGLGTPLDTKLVSIVEAVRLLEQPAAADFLVLADGVVETAALRPAEFGRIIERLFVVGNEADEFIVDAEGRSKPGTVKPIYEGVLEGCRIAITPLVRNRRKGTLEFTASFEIAQILAPVNTLESTLPNGMRAKYEIPETNETSWRSPVITCTPSMQAVVVDGIRWARVSPEDGMFDLKLVMVIEPLVADEEAGGSRDGASYTIVALGAEGTAVAEVPHGAVVPPLDARLKLVHDGVVEGVMQVVRVDGSLLRLSYAEGARARLGDRLLKP